MKKYIVKLMNGDEVYITEEEFSKMKGREGAVYVASINEIINLNRIERVFEESDAQQNLWKLPEPANLLMGGRQQEKYISDGSENIKRPVVSCKFVKMLISKMSWKNEYSHNSYCFLGEDMGKVWVGFVIPFFGSLPSMVLELTDEELRTYDLWAEATNRYPRPFKKSKQGEYTSDRQWIRPIEVRQGMERLWNTLKAQGKFVGLNSYADWEDKTYGVEKATKLREAELAV